MSLSMICNVIIYNTSQSFLHKWILIMKAVMNYVAPDLTGFCLSLKVITTKLWRFDKFMKCVLISVWMRIKPEIKSVHHIQCFMALLSCADFQRSDRKLSDFIKHWLVFDRWTEVMMILVSLTRALLRDVTVMFLDDQHVVGYDFDFEILGHHRDLTRFLFWWHELVFELVLRTALWFRNNNPVCLIKRLQVAECAVDAPYHMFTLTSALLLITKSCLLWWMFDSSSSGSY